MNIFYRGESNTQTREIVAQYAFDESFIHTVSKAAQAKIIQDACSKIAEKFVEEHYNELTSALSCNDIAKILIEKAALVLASRLTMLGVADEKTK